MLLIRAKSLFCPQDILVHLKLMKSKKECIKNYPNCTQNRGKSELCTPGPQAVCDEGYGSCTGPFGAGRHSGWGAVPPSHSQGMACQGFLEVPGGCSRFQFQPVALRGVTARFGFEQKCLGTGRQLCRTCPFSI